MTFPTPDGFNLVVAATNEDGEVDFLEYNKGPATIDIPGAVNGAWYWKVTGGHGPDNIGFPADNVDIAGRNGSSFGVMCFPAHSAGKLDVSESSASLKTSEASDDPSMHASDSVDYEIVIAGKVDVELPGGKVRTLQPGDLLVMGGVPHAWKNHYDEDCVYIAVTIGYNG